MLIISRKKSQKIVVADEIEITILEVGRNRVRFGIKAPKHIPIQTRLKNSPSEPEESPITSVALSDPPPPSEPTISAEVALFRRA